MTSEGAENLNNSNNNRSASPMLSTELPNTTFAFKLRDRRGQLHRFSCDVQTITPMITCILQKLGNDIDRSHLPRILYEDEDHDKVIIASDGDLTATVEHAKLAGWKGLKLYLDYSGRKGQIKGRSSESTEFANYNNAWAVAYAGAGFMAGVGFMVYIRTIK